MSALAFILGFAAGSASFCWLLLIFPPRQWLDD